MCEINYSFALYDGAKYLDEDGTKPCFECLLESDAFDEVEVEGE
jgi:hypothetical protein